MIGETAPEFTLKIPQKNQFHCQATEVRQLF